MYRQLILRAALRKACISSLCRDSGGLGEYFNITFRLHLSHTWCTKVEDADEL